MPYQSPPAPPPPKSPPPPNPPHYRRRRRTAASPTARRSRLLPRLLAITEPITHGKTPPPPPPPPNPPPRQRSFPSPPPRLDERLKIARMTINENYQTTNAAETAARRPARASLSGGRRRFARCGLNSAGLFRFDRANIRVNRVGDAFGVISLFESRNEILTLQLSD